MKAIKTTFKGPTNTKGSRIIATDGDRNKIIIPYPHELNTEDAHRLAATRLCAKMNWSGELITGWLKNEAVHVFKY